MLKVFEAFFGYKSQSMALKKYNVDYTTVGGSEIDEWAIITASAVHGEDKEIVYPTIEVMLERLLSRNIALNFKTGKTPWEKLLIKNKLSIKEEARVKRIYKACILTKNFGDISKIDPNELPNMDLFTYSFPCFIAGTQVLTSNGYKPIENITTEDSVMTHNKRFKKVVKPMINKADHLIKVSSMVSDDVMTTREHPFYVREKYREWDTSVRRYIRKFKQPEWLNAESLNKHYYVGTPINTESSIPKWEGGINNQWRHNRVINNLSEYLDKKDFWWFVGRYIGDGWTQNFPEKDKYRTIICCAKNEAEEIKPILDRLGMNYSEVAERTVFKYHMCNKELSLWLDRFGKYAHGKKLTKDILDLPTPLLKSFVDGYISADGCYTQGIFKVTSVSSNLIYSLGQCVAKVYKRPFSIYKNKRPKTRMIEGRLVNQRDTYQLTFKKENNKQDKAFYEDGYIWTPINKIEEVKYNGLVYNMEVKDDNSYCVQNIIVHNCQDISMAGKQRGLEEGSETRSSLLWECEKIIKAKKPKYLMMENVKNLVGKNHKPDFDKWLEVLEELGYENHWKVINAKYCGVPQNRERVFCVSILGGGDFSFYDNFDCGVRLKDILEDTVADKYYVSEKALSNIKYQRGAKFKGEIPKDKISTCLTASMHKGYGNDGCVVLREPNKIQQVTGNLYPKSGNPQAGRVYNADGISPAMDTCAGGNRMPKIVEACAIRGRNPKDPKSRVSGLPTVQMLEVKEESHISNCLTTVQKDSLVLENQLKFVGGISDKDRVGDGKNLSRNVPTGNRVYDSEGIAATQTSQGGGLGGCTGNYLHNFRIRKLTPTECFRLMGVSDEDILKIQSTGISNSQQYKLAGNSIVVPCMEFLKQLN